jgi:hypothetical protein
MGPSPASAPAAPAAAALRGEAIAARDRRRALPQRGRLHAIVRATGFGLALLVLAAGTVGAGAADTAATPAVAAPAAVADPEPPAGDDAAAGEISDEETLAFLVLVLMFPLSVLGVRWLTQRRIQQWMNRDSLENDERGPDVSDAQGVAMTVTPRFVMHDPAHGLDGAVQARERFVARSLSLFRRFVMLDVVAGLVYVVLLFVLGATRRDEAGEEIGVALGLAILGTVYPLLAGLRYGFYRRQFRPLDARFRRGWLGWIPALRLLRWLLSPKFQAVSASLWVGLMALTGVALSFDETEGPAFRATAAGLAAVAVLQPLLVWRILRRMQREPGVCLTVLRVFGIDANASFTFGRLLAFWQHFGNHFTVLDPTIWRHRYPLMSWRTGGFMLGLAAAGLLAAGSFTLYPQWEPWAFTATVPVMLGVLSAYALVSRALLRREFIRSRGQLLGVLDRLAQRPRQLDLSFRRLEAMCHNDTWKIAVEEFARRSQVLLMDLRGFSSARKGCEYEVDFLLDAVPLERVLFLVDAGGDHQVVRQLILDRWRFLSPTSPNLAKPDPVATLYVATAADEADVQGILDLLIHAAQQPGGGDPGGLDGLSDRPRPRS